MICDMLSPLLQPFLARGKKPEKDGQKEAASEVRFKDGDPMFESFLKSESFD